MDNLKKDSVRKIVMLGDSLNQSGGIATLQNLMLKHAPSDIQIQHITSHDEGSVAYRVMIFGKALATLVWKLFRNKVDLVHVHISDGGSILRKAIIALIAFLFHKPVVMHANGAIFHINYAKLPQWVQRLLRQIFQRCAAFIAVTSYWRDYYTSNLNLEKERFFVLPNPAELPDQLPNRGNAHPIKFVFCGRLGQRKGAFDCIRAFANLPASSQQQAELLMAGDGEVEQARQLVESFNLSRQIKLLGWIDSQHRDGLLEQADVFTLPTNNEGLPLALIEAMCHGLPVLTTPSSGIPDVVTSGRNGLLVKPGEIQQLSEAMQLLIEDEPLRLSLGRAARETAESLDVKSFWRHLAETYTLVLTSKLEPQQN